MKQKVQSPLSVSRERRKVHRRQKVDPRYRDPAYTDFLDRRSGEDRRYYGEECGPPAFLAEMTRRRRIIVILGVVAAVAWLSLFALAFFHLHIVSHDYKPISHPLLNQTR